MLRDGLRVLRGVYSGVCCLHDALFLKSGDLDDLAAELAGELLNVDFIASLADDIHHVYRDDDRNAELNELSREVEVSLEVRTVDDIEYSVGTLADEVISRDDLLKGVRGERIDAGEVGDDDSLVLFQLTFLFFDRYAGPVTDELIRTGKRVEQCGFATVRVAREGYADIHFKSFFHEISSAIPLVLANRMA